VSNKLADYRQRHRELPRLQRELVTFAGMLLLALTVLPVAVFTAGKVFLGDYVRDPSGSPVGGLGAFWTDYLAGIFTGSFGHWLVLLGPWLLVVAGRGIVALARGEPDRKAPGAVKSDINQPLA
jgi:hypothetical protein